MRRALTLLAAVLLQVWQLPQNLAGLVFGWFLRGKRRYCNFPGIPESIHVMGADNMHGGISLGNFEYGHCRQSRILGPFYLLVIGIPSLLWALWWHPGRSVGYYSFFTERWADRLGGVRRKGGIN